MSSKAKNNWLGQIANRIESASNKLMSIATDAQKTLFPPLLNKKKWRKEIPMRGFNKSDVEIELDGKFLIVSARKSSDSRHYSENSISTECKSYMFKRTFGLPFSPKERDLKARYRNDRLIIEIPYPKNQKELAWYI